MIDTTTIKHRLEDELARITNDLRAVAHYDESTDNWEAIPDTTELEEADENVSADAVEDWNERRATVSDLEIEYRDLKRALAKIAAGTYGICEISGEPIEERRLMIKPTARTCAAHMNDEATLPLN